MCGSLAECVNFWNEAITEIKVSFIRAFTIHLGIFINYKINWIRKNNKVLIHQWAQRHVWLSLHGASGSWRAQGFVWDFQVSSAGMRFDSKCDFTPPTLLLGLLLYPWMWGVFFWWDPTFSCWWLFSNYRTGFICSSFCLWSYRFHSFPHLGPQFTPASLSVSFKIHL